MATEKSDIIISSEVETIKLTRGHFALIDKEDEFLVSTFNKFRASRTATGFYAVTSQHLGKKKYKTIYLHRIVFDKKIPEGYVLRFKNGNTLDCRKQNLEFIERTYLSQQTNYTTKKLPIGVHKHGNKYVAKTSIKGKRITLGSFDSQQEAAIAYNKKAIEIFGKRARINK